MMALPGALDNSVLQPLVEDAMSFTGLASQHNSRGYNISSKWRFPVCAGSSKGVR